MKKLALGLSALALVLVGIWTFLVISSDSSQNPSQARNAFTESAALYARGDLARARELLQVYCSEYPQHFESKLLYARVCAESGHTKEATRILEELTKSGRKDAEIVIVHAQVAVSSGQPAHALSLLRQATMKEPKDARLWRELAILEYQLGQSSEAMASAHRSLQLDASQEDLTQLTSELSLQSATSGMPRGLEMPQPGLPQHFSMPQGRAQQNAYGAPEPFIPSPAGSPSPRQQNGWPR
jgi:predicted Zn-dependent protease